MRELVRVTRLNGLVECVEADPVLHQQGPATRRLLEQMTLIQHARGISPDPIRQLGTLFEQAGLQQVEVQTILLPFGEWGGRVGTMLKQDALSVFAARKEPCCHQGELAAETFDNLLTATSQEWETFRTSRTCSAVTGRRVSE